MTIDYTCRLCNEPGHVDVDGEAMVAIDGTAYRKIASGWPKLLCHDRCHDIRSQRIKSEQRIYALLHLMRLAKEAPKYSDQQRDIRVCREAIFEESRTWAKNEAKYHWCDVMFWHESFPESLIDLPTNSRLVFSNAREYIAGQCKQYMASQGAPVEQEAPL